MYAESKCLSMYAELESRFSGLLFAHIRRNPPRICEYAARETKRCLQTNERVYLMKLVIKMMEIETGARGWV